MAKDVPIKPRAKSADDWVAAPAPEKGRAKPEPNKRLTIDIPASLHRRIKSTCAQRGELMADVLREILEREFG